MLMDHRTAMLLMLACGLFLSVVCIGSLVAMRTPEKSDLATIEGRVSEVELIKPPHENFKFWLEDSPSTFRYVEHLPSFQAVRGGVAPGRTVTVYVDEDSVDKEGDVTIWGIDNTLVDRPLVTFEALVEWRSKNRKVALIMLPICLLIAIVGGVGTWFEFRPRRA